jgi:hypothetical protein
MAAELSEMVRKQLLENINQGKILQQKSNSKKEMMFSFDLFQIFSGNIEEVRRILDVGQIKVDSSDEVGTLLPLFTAVSTT